MPARDSSQDRIDTALPEPGEQLLQEYFDSRGEPLEGDSATGVLRGVKLLGLRSRNGRTYREAALRDAIGLYEGARVNVNHPPGDPLGPRDYRDRLGVVRGVRLRAGEGLFGDLHYNPRHPLAEQLAWDASHAPENVGLSHNVVARTSRTGGGVVVEAITHVRSVDLVADPATTLGLFEQTQPRFADLAVAEGEGDALRELREENARLAADLAAERRRGAAERALRKRGVLAALERSPRLAVVAESIVASVAAAPQDRLEDLAEAWAAAVGPGSGWGDEAPTARERVEGAGFEPPCDASDFARRLTRGPARRPRRL